MAIRNVWIEDGCTACELCVDICPEVFEMSTDTAMVIEEVNFDDHSENIREAADGCPVEVIRFEE